MQEENGKWFCFSLFKVSITVFGTERPILYYYTLRLKYAMNTKQKYGNTHNYLCFSNVITQIEVFCKEIQKGEMDDKSFSVSQHVLMHVKIWVKVSAVSDLNHQIPTKPFSLVNIRDRCKDPRQSILIYHKNYGFWMQTWA